VKVICDGELLGDASVDKVLLALTGFHAHLLTRIKTNQPRARESDLQSDRYLRPGLVQIPIFTLQILICFSCDTGKWFLSGPYDCLMLELLAYWRKTWQKAAQRVRMWRKGRLI